MEIRLLLLKDILVKYLKKLNNFLLLVHTILFNLITSVFFSLFSKFVLNGQLKQNGLIFSSLKEEFLTAILIAPLLETLIFQYSIMEILKYKFSTTYCCIISAILFALTHAHSVLYFLWAIFAGLSFSVLYHFGSVKKKGFILVVTGHALYNLTGFLLHFI
jgi:membrane protease YdiL (CAAX protease family)